MSRFFQFSNYAGRLVSSTQAKAYNPAGLSASVPAEVTRLVFESPKVQIAKVKKSFSTSPSSGGAYGSTPAKISRTQELMQKNDGVPVHLKGGPMDRGLFLATMALCGLGILGSLHTYYSMSFPKRPE